MKNINRGHRIENTVLRKMRAKETEEDYDIQTAGSPKII